VLFNRNTLTLELRNTKLRETPIVIEVFGL